MRFLSRLTQKKKQVKWKQVTTFYRCALWKWNVQKLLFNATSNLWPRSRAECVSLLCTMKQLKASWEIVSQWRAELVRTYQRKQKSFCSRQTDFISNINIMTDHIYSTDDYSFLNSTARYYDANGTYSYYDINYGSTEASFNETFNETWVFKKRRASAARA